MDAWGRIRKRLSSRRFRVVSGDVSPEQRSSGMDRLHAMQVFTRVVEARSFTKAAESLSAPPSSVTRVIK
ncbi:MAG: LysR family transcriptional regulator, partial [Rhodanobacter sp.]